MPQRTVTKPAASKVAPSARPTAIKSPPQRKAAAPLKAARAKSAPVVVRVDAPTGDGLRPKDLIVQSDLAMKEARDQWSRMTAELERRRRAADKAVQRLRDTSADASHTLADAVRQAVSELSDAVEAMFGKRN
jgi:hypothetical protein